MSLSFNEVGTNANQIDITAIRSQVKHVTTKCQQFCSVVDNFIRIYPHLIFSNINAPIFYNFEYEFHGLVFLYFLGRFLIKIVLIQYFLHKLSIDIISLSFYVKYFTIS